MKPLVIAHRGASAIAPENTIAAFLAAQRLGTDGIETDVQLTREGKLVMHHNYTIDANSNGSGRISDMSLEEIRRFDFGSWKGPEFAGEKIPTLDECLAVTSPFRVINIELKAPMNRSIPYVQPVADAIAASGLQEKIIVSAFDHTLLREMKQYLPSLRVGALTLPSIAGNPSAALMQSCFPDNVPMDRIRPEALRLPKENIMDGNPLGVNGKDLPAILMELAHSMSAMYPGDTLREIMDQLERQNNLDTYIAGLDFHVDYLHCEYHSCLSDPQLIEKLHQRGVGVNPWTVDTPADLLAILAMQPDGIITNRPDTLLSLLNT